MALNPKWNSPEWRELLGRLDGAHVYMVQQGNEGAPGPTEDSDTTQMLRAVPGLHKELERLQEKERWIDMPGILREAREQTEHLRQEIATLAALVRRSAPKP